VISSFLEELERRSCFLGVICGDAREASLWCVCRCGGAGLRGIP
jgi:hypothetical protein